VPARTPTKRGWRLRGRRSSWAITLLAAACGIAALNSGLGEAIDRAFDPLRFAVIERSASRSVAIVEMDAASVAAIRTWPWSRAHHARVVDALRRAGAASIVFDVDFSSPSDAAGDRAFADALARTDGMVALPTFAQRASAAEGHDIDMLPLPAFGAHAASASVSIMPDPDGNVRAMPFATITAGTPRPSLSAFIAARSGTADTTFPIDMAINPASIPRLSFVDVDTGRFDPAVVRGRNVLIGATAIELGDRYSTPRWGIIPGVVVQALAAETLIHGVPHRGAAIVAILLALLMTSAITAMRSTGRIVAMSAAMTIVLATTILVAQYGFLLIYPAAAAAIMLSVGTAACLIRAVLDQFTTQRMRDEATKLPNRRALQAAIARAPMPMLAVTQITNLDRIVAVLGNAVSDQAVLRVSERLALCCADGVIYRIADHQLAFAVPLDQSIDEVMDTVRTLLLQPVEVNGRRVDIGAAIGIAAEHGEGDRIIVDATLAADQASRDGLFWRQSATDVSTLDREISLMGELDDAIANRMLEVHYQPKLSLLDDRITSVEALVRWRHPERGFIGPDIFVPLAERSDRIAPMTLYVIERVLDDVAQWRAEGLVATAAINISAKLLSEPVFNRHVVRMLERTSVPTAALIFEVTESAAMLDPDAAIAALRHYRDLGIAVSMDDYGTGQSTLTYLRQLPLAELKIDRSFVQHAHIRPNDGVLVRSTIDLAHDLGLKVVAEGVENQACLEFLKRIGCDMIQGYLISKPLPFSQLLNFMHMNDLAPNPSWSHSRQYPQ
jgi:EAL domain-containing protein (putative c-di-GMP-specific phosphodiesterase class I)/CHASE2 domain-containing sensor protein